MEDSPFIDNKKVKPSERKAVITKNGPTTILTKIIGVETPEDRYKAVFFIFILHGVGTLMAWNMFITAKSYFEEFKLSKNYTGETEVNYRGNFMQNIGFASQIPNVLFNWINIFVRCGGDLTQRIVYSILCEIALLIVTIILAMVNSSEWPGVFFWSTMVSIVLINMCNGVYQSTIYGLGATLPPKYTGAIVLGSNVCGCVVTLMSIASTAIFDSPRTAAIYYFITAIIVLLLCFDTYFALPLTRFFRHYDALSNAEEKAGESEGNVAYWEVFKTASPQLLNVFLTFFVTLATFPAVYSDIKPSSDFIIGDKYFTLITCFLTFNVFAMLGSLTTSWVRWPGPKYLWLPVVLRFAFIPLMLFCNYLPKDIERTLPVLITNDWVYWIIGILMSYSSGYLSSLGMMYTPDTVTGRDKVTAGMLGAAMLVTGIFAGVMGSYLMPIFIQL